MSFSLTVTQSELLPALKILSGVVKPKQASEAVLTHTRGTLTISLPGASVDVSAPGTWPGLVRFPGQFLLTLARVPPRGDPLNMTVAGGRFRVGTASVECSVEEARQKPGLEVPLDAPLPILVRVSLMHDVSEIERAGLAPLIKSAIERRDQMLNQAAKSLAPLGVRPEDLIRFINDFLTGDTKGK